MDKRKFIKLSLTGAAGICCGASAISGVMGSQRSNKMTFLDGPKLNKWSREAMFYEVTPRGVKCLICPNECNLKEGELSICHNRINYADKLYTLAYGDPCAVHVDPVEKKPLFHFLPGTSAFSVATAGCNLACLNCQNWEISQTSPDKTTNFDLMPEKIPLQAIENKCSSIAYTYSEPISFYEYTYDSAINVHKKGLKNILKSAGYINEKPLRQLAQYIDAANIDLKSFKDSIYLKLSAGRLQPILDTLKILKEEKVWLEITNLLIPGWTDDPEMIREMCNWLCNNGFADTPLHFSRFQPGNKLAQLPATPLETLEQARSIANSAGINFVYVGNIPGTEYENTSCPKCKKLLIRRKGYQIAEYHIHNGNCLYCGARIPGVWE
jgi:pyruvate formate lyase activating enzyme